MNILGVETTCDETSLSLVKDGRKIIHEKTVSQILKHAPYGGVVPDLGAREHLQNLSTIGKEFMQEIKGNTIDAIAVAAKIGLPPAVQVGEAYAAGLAQSLGVPLIEINHVIAHIWGVWIDEAFEQKPVFPFLGLIVSGGHTQLYSFNGPDDYELLGESLDDAVGEVFDKVAAMLGLPYPGGPQVEAQAVFGDETSIKFPIPLKNDDRISFSFSGLKTAVRTYIEKEKKNHTEITMKYFTADVCAAFQQTAFTAIAYKVIQAMKNTKYKSLVVGGGVAANQRLTDILFNQVGRELNFDLYVPARKYCTDNASLIAGYAYNLV